jgi:hypothetical protein
MLEDAGLAAALHALAEDAPRLSVREVPTSRFPAATESAAYHLVLETLRQGGGGRVVVRACVDGATLALEVSPVNGGAGQLTDAEDRIGALGGRLVREHGGVLRAEIPCV